MRRNRVIALAILFSAVITIAQNSDDLNRISTYAPMDIDSSGLCAEFRFPPPDIFTSCANQEIIMHLACCDTATRAGDTIKITSSDSTVEFFDSTSMSWQPVVSLDPTPWGTYWVRLDTDSCDWVWSEYPATSYSTDMFRSIIHSGCTNVDTAFIRIQVDNKGTVYANGTYVDTTHGNPGGGSTGWRTLHEFDLTPYFHGPVDTLEILGANAGGIAGIIFELYVVCGGCCGNIDPYSIVFTINGDEITYDSTSLVWDGESLLTYTPIPPDTFHDGDTVLAELLYAADSCGWEFDTTIFDASLRFFVDLTPPIISLIDPPLGDLNSLPAAFAFEIFDNLSGLDSASVIIDVNGLVFSIGENGSEYILPDLILNSSDAGIVWSPGDSIIISIWAQDTPDLCAPNSDSARYAWFMRDPDAPIPSIVEPSPWIYSACAPESIVIQILDPHGIDESTIRLHVNGNDYDLTDSELSWSEPFLTFFAADGWPAEDTITVSLEHAEDIFGNDISSPLSWSFIVDYDPPTADFLQPAVPMVPDIYQDIEIRICDALSGPDSSTAVLTIDGVSYEFGDFEWSQSGCANLYFRPEDVGLTFVNGETVHVCLDVGDSPDRCAPNMMNACWSFLIEPIVGCEVIPNPFSPNGDGINDNALFFYPNMFSQPAEIVIFSTRNQEIWRSEVPVQEDISSAPGRLWNGKDNSGAPMEPGLYIYIMKSGGRILCNGTLLLVR